MLWPLFQEYYSLWFDYIDCLLILISWFASKFTSVILFPEVIHCESLYPLLFALYFISMNSSNLWYTGDIQYRTCLTSTMRQLIKKMNSKFLCRKSPNFFHRAKNCKLMNQVAKTCKTMAWAWNRRLDKNSN